MVRRNRCADPGNSRNLRGNPVELIKTMVMPQAHRFALYFEVPAVLDRPAPQFTIRRVGTRSIARLGDAHALAGGAKLHDQPFERLADPAERGDTLFVQFPGNAIVRIRRPTHASTIAGTAKAPGP